MELKIKNGQITFNLLQCIIYVVDYVFVEKMSKMEYDQGINIGF
jgi:hypothetical protein